MARLLVIVSYKVFPAHMGGQKGIVHFYEQLKHHHGIRMAVSDDNEQVPSSYPVERILRSHRRMAGNLLHIGKLVRLIKKHQADAIIAEHSYTGWMAWLLKKRTGKPFIIHSHNIEASRFRQMRKSGWRVYQYYERWIHRKADFSFFKTEEDRRFAMAAFSLSPAKCSVIPYGVNAVKKVNDAKQKIRQQYDIHNRYIFYFNGTLDYAPNYEAVQRIVDAVIPLLRKSKLDFIILISGKGLPPALVEKIELATDARYIHFVEDVATVYQAADLFLNPVLNDSGVKTKVVEALANNCTVVSTQAGATGVPKELCGQKLVTTEDGNWQAFAAAILDEIAKPPQTLPHEFLDYFSWPVIAKKAAAQIQATISHAKKRN